MYNSDEVITVSEAAKLFNRSEKQIRRIVIESVEGKRSAKGDYIVAPDPLFATLVLIFSNLVYFSKKPSLKAHLGPFLCFLI